jgi:hypothetical protein
MWHAVTTELSTKRRSGSASRSLKQGSTTLKKYSRGLLREKTGWGVIGPLMILRESPDFFT